jgi:hypothetical protein
MMCWAFPNCEGIQLLFICMLGSLCREIYSAASGTFCCLWQLLTCSSWRFWDWNTCQIQDRFPVGQAI